MAGHSATFERLGGGGTWTVLVILGPSGVGKSLAAQSIALAREQTWVQVDDLRLAIQASRTMLPAQIDRLSYFDQASGLWSQPVEQLREAIEDIARLMAPAVRIVIDSHIVTNVPMVIEGDGILPALASDPVLDGHVRAGRLSFCCVTPGSVEELLENMLARGRGIDRTVSDGDKLRQAEMNAAYGRWLEAECARRKIPVVESRPFATLAQRIVSAVEST